MGRTAFNSPRWNAKMCFMYHSSVVGMLTKRMDSAVALLAAELVHVHQRAQLFHPRQNGQLLGLHVADAGGAQHRDHVGRDLLPMTLNLLLDIDFVDGQPLVDGIRVPGLAMEQLGFDVEGVRQAMGGVDAHHQGAVSETGEFQPGSRRQTGFPHPSLPAEQKDAHNSILARSDGGSIRAAKHRWAGVGIARLPRYRSNSAVPAAALLSATDHASIENELRK